VDIIGIDQLADSSTVSQALEVALTGHLVLSSLPVNDVFSAIARLNKLADPALVADTLIGVINQRLVRRVCPVCRLKHQPKAEELAKFGLSTAQASQYSFYKANSLTPEEANHAREKGRLCRHCNGVGYQGQIGVFEVITVTPHLKAFIADNKPAEILKKVTLQAGLKPLLAYGLELASQGHTTLEEIERVIADELTFSALTSPTSVNVSPAILARIESIERLFQALNSEFTELKREISAKDSIIPPAIIESPTVIYEQFNDFATQEIPPKDWSADKETIVSDASIYEELTDPGDWEQLKQELDPNKDTIVSSEMDDHFSLDVNTSFRSVPDPWS
jgi:type IV pilus assembly protein PilB